MKTRQVFLSHTSDMAHFPEDRSFVQAALDAVGRLRLAPVDMRYLAARDGRPADYCQQRVLTCDPGTGVMRHADAGYERAIEVAAERGVDLPMVRKP